jgi:hypothetical protein
MGIVSYALRVAAIAALKGQTLAGDAVVDTFGDLGGSDEDRPRFTIVVATEKVTARAITLSITLSVLVRTVENLANGPAMVWRPAVTSGAFERALDILAAQAVRALFRAQSGWGDVFANLAGGNAARTLEMTKADGVHATRLITVTAEPPADLERNHPFLLEIEASEAHAGDRDILAAYCSGGPIAESLLGLPCGLTAAEAAELVALNTPAASEAGGERSRRGRSKR